MGQETDMTTYDGTDTTAPEVGNDTEQPSPATSELKAYNKRLEERVKDLEQKALRGAVESIGLNPDRELGVAIVDQYPVKDHEVTTEAVAAWASEKFKYEPPEDPNPQADTIQQIDAANAVAEGIESVSQPIAPTTQDDTVRELDAKLADPDATPADAERAIAAKMAGFQPQR
jgi:hypothetical protein